MLLAYNGVPPEGDAVDRVVVKWVDFTHMVRVDKRDENFLFGLENLIKYLERLIDTEAAAPYIAGSMSKEGNHVKS